MKVPMVDLHVQYESLKEEVDAAIDNVLDSTTFILGPEVERFERAYAAYHGIGHCIAVSNGTDALTLTLRALGIGEDDEVITTCHTFSATLEAICHVGARPVLVDIDPDLYTMRVDQVERLVTERTRAILPVHLYGHPVDMDPLLDVANRRDLYVVEDAAQAHGAVYRERLAGTIGDAGCFSFYPGKNLGAYGDAGGILTDDADLAGRLRQLRNHGQQAGVKFYYHRVGYNNRMDAIQGAVLNVKLPHLQKWNEARQDHAEYYRRGLDDVEGVKVPKASDDVTHVYHLFVIEVDDRDHVNEALQNEGIASGIQYPFPLHLSPAYSHLGYRRGDFPTYEAASRRIVSLPMYPELTSKQLDHVVRHVRGAVIAGSRRTGLRVTRSDSRQASAAA